MTTQTDQPSAPPALRPRRTRLIAGAGALLLLAAGTVAVLRTGREDSAAESSGPDAAVVGAQAAVRSFLAASTPEARAAFVLNGDRILPDLQSYYAGRDPEVLDSAAFQPLPWRFDGPAGQTVVLRAERDRGLPAVIAAVKLEKGQWLLDWELWVQTEDGLFSQFQNRPQEGSETTLRLRLAAAPGDTGNCQLTVTDPFEGQSMTLPVDRPDLAALYTGAVTGSPRHATVQLVWLNDTLSGTLKPTVRRHVCWGFDGLDRQDAVIPTGPLPPAPPAGAAPAVLAGADKVKVVTDAVNVATAAPGLSTPPDRPVATQPATKVTGTKAIQPISE